MTRSERCRCRSGNSELPAGPPMPTTLRVAIWAPRPLELMPEQRPRSSACTSIPFAAGFAQLEIKRVIEVGPAGPEPGLAGEGSEAAARSLVSFASGVGQALSHRPGPPERRPIGSRPPPEPVQGQAAKLRARACREWWARVRVRTGWAPRLLAGVLLFVAMSSNACGGGDASGGSSGRTREADRAIVLHVGQRAFSKGEVDHWVRVVKRGGAFDGSRGEPLGGAKQRALALLISCTG